ncbi:MAG: IS481 family transposase [Jatrophihabitantaceae bacterium]
MSKARLVITAVGLEGRPAGQVAAEYGVSKSWLYELLARYRAEGEAAFEPRSRRPLNSPNASSPATVELVVGLRTDLRAAGHDAGPATIAWHLRHHHQLSVSVATVARILTRQGLITPAPKKRPKASYIRFQAAMPNECWQSDFTHYRLADGADTEIITWLDDHSRIPASTLTDNGMVYTVRLATGRSGLEAELHRLHIQQKNSRPNHPTTCGKIERFQQTLKKWLRAQPDQPTTTAQLQALIDAYNHHRPHRSLPHSSTPATAYTSRPKATPSSTRTGEDHDRVLADRIDTDGKLTLRLNGQLHHIGMGRALARTPVLKLVQDLHVRIIHAATGELLRELTIDPDKDYQPTGNTRYPTEPKKPNPEGSAGPGSLEISHWWS